MQRAPRTYAFEIVLDLLDTAGDAAAVGFELGFAGTAGADSAAEARHLDAASGEPRQAVIQLREFDLQAAFASAGTRREDVENELCAVDDLGIQRFLEVAL